ncbi:EF-hand domain-containing family member C2 isoform X1 [Sorex fumeus]|uniref:EF-hand domain-containing family member C2 isoform X1 n=1 Tax=Sorex fumeus TaxID=62283 RepID=UPI0024AE2EA3|nr:EF-hand domain-containing family member C2 isoform X1 [Sorex fumeus]
MFLPVLPGYDFNRNVTKERFHKSQLWGFCNNVRMLVSEDKPGIGGELFPGQRGKPPYTAFPRGNGYCAPSWAAFDKQVLSFDAYLEDEVPEKVLEKYRIRIYKIYFYLEDDTIEVNEPLVKNSGLPQGIFIRRHRIALPAPDDDKWYTVYDFNIGIDVVFYGRTFKIYDCDGFTKNFLRKVGIKLNPPRECPRDPYIKMRREQLECMEPLRPYEPHDTLRSFLEYDKKVLRFYCLWDDTPSFFGDRRKLVLHYYLCDGTIDIKELQPQNSGRYPTSRFLRRGKLPKYGPPGIYEPGQITAQTVLNVYGGYSVTREYGFLLDKYKPEKLHQEFYKDTDLLLGAKIDVWGRKVLLCNCDEFTKLYYLTKYGIECTPPISCKPPEPPKIERKFPPYNGFGSEEDSLRSCIGLVPTPHQRDFKKFMESDSYGNVSNTLRFFARMCSRKNTEINRMFVISYFLGDDTLSVFEPILKNSGYAGGLFLKRSRVKRPGQEVFKSEPSEYIQPEEFYIGTKVNVNGYVFHLLNADEYTLTFMEKHPDRFPLSDIKLALQKLKAEQSKSREIQQVFIALDSLHTRKVDFNTFSNTIKDIVAGNITDQEVITIARHFRVPEEICPEREMLLAEAHEQLKKYNFDAFDKLIAECIYEDRAKKNTLPTNDIRRLCKSHRVPFSSDLLLSLSTNFENSENQIDYRTFFDALNWRQNPKYRVEGPQFYEKQVCEDEWTGKPSPIPVKYVNYMALLRDVYGIREEDVV